MGTDCHTLGKEITSKTRVCGCQHEYVILRHCAMGNRGDTIPSSLLPCPVILPTQVCMLSKGKPRARLRGAHDPNNARSDHEPHMAKYKDLCPKSQQIHLREEMSVRINGDGL